MAYSQGYDAYDPYMSRSLSRRQSINYPGTPYPHHQGYPDGVAGSEYQQPYQIYGPPSNAVVPMSRRLTGQGYDMEDPYYDERHGQIPLAHSNSMIMPRHRRHSTVSFAARPPGMDAYRVPSALHLKFKRKGSFTSGIGLDEAQSRIRLSGNDAYSFHDLHADSRGRIYLRVKWTGYSSLTYEIRLDGYDGRVDLQTLARRVSRACVHYLQANVIPILWDRVLLHHLEEVSYGVWQPMLSTR
ncbi:hypothetical protein GALMADRAFT_85634 [Galerina marginata CBS 339.88]|uniref:DUF6741 domain-containing protein n=1 Tax=Galerina marginata (strain CBS 339.88) TaxID=685588 RepID=A0A067TMD4_GALM3|nr:hypothetical protein GALMADRAFT_85634 [Galerina marginata CBS 339.88]